MLLGWNTPSNDRRLGNVPNYLWLCSLRVV
jgi:hypothetical protein